MTRGEKNWENKNKVQRCGSSDSAMGHSEDESTWREKKETDCEPYSYVEPVKSPYSPRGSIDHDNVPSRTLIESQFVPLPWTGSSVTVLVTVTIGTTAAARAVSRTTVTSRRDTATGELPRWW
jgi:hypothetical protein